MIKLSFNAHRIRDQLVSIRPNLFRMAYAWCGDRALADDLVQETVVKSLEKSHQLKDIDKIAPWCYRILHNCWLTHLRNIKPDVDIDEIVLTCNDCPEKHYRDMVASEAIRVAIGKLPVGQRKVLMLIDLEGFAYREVADILSIPVGTVMSRISRARSALEKSLASFREMEGDSSKVTKLRSIT
jgi:RNA polymerase sigma-70 factor (ECF subfamily)